MAPNGEGANLAMHDDAELGRAIAAPPGDVKTALTEFEQGKSSKRRRKRAVGRGGATEITTAMRDRLRTHHLTTT
jgi:2-polyprenyl-6-methoxyphenol hydroxylase-like FAD-dependent oxidoreductase